MSCALTNRIRELGQYLQKLQCRVAVELRAFTGTDLANEV